MKIAWESSDLASMQQDTRLGYYCTKITTLCMFLILMGLFLLHNSVYAAYQPIVGIPEPKWGSYNPIDMSSPKLPSAWPGQQVVGFYYIDNTHPQATDSANTYGYPNKPRMTFPSGGSLKPGDVVVVQGGPYSQDKYSLTSSGTENSPIFIRGLPGSKPVLERTLRIRGSYIIVEDVLFDMNRRQEGAIDIRPDISDAIESVHHIMIRNVDVRNHFLGTNSGATSISATGVLKDGVDNYVHDIIYYNNHIFPDNLSTYPSPDAFEYDFHCLGVSSRSYNVWMLNNEIHHCAGDGIGTGHGANYTAHHYYIGGNKIYSTGENGFDIKEVEHFVFSQNTLYGFQGISAGSNGTAVVVHYGPALRPKNVWILLNDIYNSPDAGIQIGSDGEGIYVIGNKIHGITNSNGTGKGIVSWSAQNIYLIGNTLWGNDNNIILTGSDTVDSYAIVENNLLDTVLSASGYHLRADYTAYRDRSMVEYNLFYQSGGSSRIGWGSTYDVNGFKAATGKCVGCIEGNPKFTTAPLISQVSPAVNSGKVSDVYEKFALYFGLDIAVDISGSLRPQGGRWDIGSHESITPPPPATMSLEVM